MTTNTAYFSNDTMHQYMHNHLWYYANSLFNHMCGLYSSTDIFNYLLTLFRRYQIGITLDDEVVYWQHDINNRCNTAKIVKYDTNGLPIDNSTRTLQASPGSSPEYYPFGLHLLPTHPEDMSVAVVSSEKSALMGATYNVLYLRNDTRLPLFIACGSTSLVDTLHHLTGRNVTLFPDDAHTQEWTRIAQQHSYLLRSIEVNDMVHRFVNANLIPQGSDYSTLMINMRMGVLRNRPTQQKLIYTPEDLYFP